MRLAGFLWVTSVIALSGQSAVQMGKAIFRGVVVEYRVVDGRAIFDGDIELGPVESLVPATGPQPRSAYIEPARYRWPNGNIPYMVDPDVPNPQRITDAVAAWNSTTPLHLTPRIAEANYVHFIRQQNSGTCFSSIGMVGGEQFIRTDDQCSANGLAHELGHSIGLYHEQSRADRDYYLTVDLSKVDKRRIGDLSIKVPLAADGGGYDFGSIMHYTRTEASQDRLQTVLETIPAGMPIEESAHGLSAGDIDRVIRMYGAAPPATTITTNPAGQQILVDGELYVGPMAFNWAAGSVHTVDVPDKQGDGAPTRYLFGRWSDNKPKQHSFTASADVTVYEASLVRQYLVRTAVTVAGTGAVTISPSSPDGYYNDGAMLTVSATPADGYAFQSWSGFVYTTLDGLGTPVNRFLIRGSGFNYTATFTKSAVLVVTTDPPNLPVTAGTTRASGPRNISVTPGGTLAVAADATISFGTSVTQYVFTGWSDGGAASHTVNIPSSGPLPTLTAKYRVQHLVSTAFTGRGTVTVTPPSTDGYYDHGTTVQITAAPAAGYQLLNWSGDFTDSALVHTVTVNDQVYAQAAFLQPFTLTSTGVVNAASFLNTSVSPGEILTIFGMALGPPNLAYLTLDDTGKVSTTAGGVRVLFDGVAAPMVYAAQNQVAPIVPYAVTGKASTNIQVEYNGARTPALSVPVAASAPALFTLHSSGAGQAATLNQDGSVNSSANPAAKGSVVVLFATGEGQTNPGGVDGKLASSQPLPAPLLPVTVLVGGPQGVGKNASVLYAGAAPTLVAGVLQINIVIPTDAPSGNVPLSISVGGVSSGEMATVAIQ
jgi:uncharacterized protein (TIGR03437 family)